MDFNITQQSREIKSRLFDDNHIIRLNILKVRPQVNRVSGRIVAFPVVNHMQFTRLQGQERRDHTGIGRPHDGDSGPVREQLVPNNLQTVISAAVGGIGVFSIIILIHVFHVEHRIRKASLTNRLL